MNVEVDDDNGRLLVADADKTVAIWAWEDTPKLYRDVITFPDDVDPKDAFVALVPAGYKRDIEHITRDPYFGGKMLDVYTLFDDSKLYVGA